MSDYVLNYNAGISASFQGQLSSGYTNWVQSEVSANADFIAYTLFTNSEGAMSLEQAIALRTALQEGDFNVSDLFLAAQSKVGEVDPAGTPKPVLNVDGFGPIDLSQFMGGGEVESWQSGSGKTLVYHSREFLNEFEGGKAEEGWDEPDPVGHDGDFVVAWDFESHTLAEGDNVGTPDGFWNLNQWAANNPQYYPDADDVNAFQTDIQVHGVDGARALDTAASPGNIFLQAAPIERDGVAVENGTMPDLETGQTYHATVSILKQDFSGNQELVDQGYGGTDPEAWVSFQFNGTELNVRASDINVSNQFVTFDTTFQGVEGEDFFTIMSHGTQDDNQGLLIDSIVIHEWDLV